MSQSFRPVKEIWNVHSSCFIEPEKLEADERFNVGSFKRQHGRTRGSHQQE